MQVNNENISNEELADIVEEIRPYADSIADPPTEFELNTAIAFVYFKRRKCDIVVLEAGMGGEFDATNVIKSPEAVIFTNIGLDHTQVLGDTVEKIAATKAGVIKEGTRVILYEPCKASVKKIIEERCKEKGALLLGAEPEKMTPGFAGVRQQEFSYKEEGTYCIHLAGNYQLNNAAVVLKTIEVLNGRGFKISKADISLGLWKTKWPGRFECIKLKPAVIIDGGHNPQGVQGAADTLKHLYGDKKIIFVFGVLADKDYAQMLDIIIPLAKEVITVTPPNARALSSEAAAEQVRKRGVKAQSFADFDEATKAAVSAAKDDDVICAIGSLYMLAKIKAGFEKAFKK